MPEITDLRQRIANIVNNVEYGMASAGEAADAIIAALPDPRLGIGGNQPPDEEIEEDRLLRVDPENLLVVEPTKLPALFSLHYPALAERAAEMRRQCEKWQVDHKTPAGGWIDIKDDAENAAVADLVLQLDNFANEAEETRVRVKLLVREAGTQIDGYFKGGMIEPVLEIRGVTRTVSGKRYAPGPGTLQFAQTKYLTDKAERERQDRIAAAREAEIEAERRAEEARQLAKQEQKRAAELANRGIASEEAREIARAETDQAAAVADAAQTSSALIGSYATESSAAMVRQHTASGTTVGLSGRWTFEVASMVELCLAVGAPALTLDRFVQQVAAAASVGLPGARIVLEAAAKVLTSGGTLPATFVTTDDKNIRAAITARTAPLRDAPGLRIFQEVSARRRSA